MEARKDRTGNKDQAEKETHGVRAVIGCARIVFVRNFGHDGF
jgi:hypothetical protein